MFSLKIVIVIVFLSPPDLPGNKRMSGVLSMNQPVNPVRSGCVWLSARQAPGPHTTSTRRIKMKADHDNERDGFM